MLYQRGKIWYLKIKYGGKTFRKSTGQTDKAQAKKFHANFRRKLRGVSMYALADESESIYRSGGAAATITREWRAECDRAINTPNSWLIRALSRVNSKNKHRFEIKKMSKEHIYQIALRSNGRCAITGLPFTFEEMGNTGNKNPCCASIDRIDSRLGYSLDNCRFVLLSVNIAMANWGEDIFWAIAEAAVARRLREGAHILVRTGEMSGRLEEHVSKKTNPDESNDK